LAVEGRYNEQDLRAVLDNLRGTRAEFVAFFQG
jgi:hypothetical protein